MDFLKECNKCGKCKQLCPSYQIFLNESFSPRGRIMLINTLKDENQTISSDSLSKRIFSCLLCGNCENLCPVHIKMSTLIYKTRAKIKKRLSFCLFKYFSFYPRIFFSALHILKRSKIILNHKRLSYLNKFVPVNIKPKQFEGLKVYSKLKPIGRIAIFSGCSTNYLLPSITNSLIYILNWFNYEVIIPKQHCCGAPLLSTGFYKDAEKLAKKNIEIYKSFNIDGVISPCPTCSHFIGDIYKEIIGQGVPLLSLSDLFEKSEKKSNQLIKNSPENKIFFHISCHSSNYIKDADKTLEMLKNLGVSDIQKKTGCCGFGGIFSFLFEKQSMDILQKKVLEYESADMIISSCPNCIIQFRIVMKHKKILHYTELIHKILLEGEKNGKRFFEF